MKLYSSKFPDLVAVPVNVLPDGSKQYDIVKDGKVLETVCLYDDEISEDWKEHED